MALMKWEPSEGLATLQKEVNRLFESFFDTKPFHFGASLSEPAVEVSDTKEAVLIKAQVPGVTKEQLQVSISENAVTLKGEMKEEEKQEEKNFLRREFRYGAFSRTIPLSVAVKADEATAQLKDGILIISIPKSEEAKVKEIPVQV